MRKKILGLLIIFCIECCFSAVYAADQNASIQSDLQQKILQLQQQIQGKQAAAASSNATQANLSDNTSVAASIAQAQNQSSSQAATPDAALATPAQAAYAGVVSSPSSLQTSADQMNEQAFSGVINQMLPMTPEQVAKLHEVFNEAQRAAATPPGVPPKPTTTSLLVNLSPQAAPPVIRLGAGYITSLVFVDSSGQPWPIQAYSLGDPTAFNIQWDRKSNTLLTQSATFFKRSNLAVILKDLNTPVMLTLLSGQEAVDYRVDLRIPQLGPNAMFVQNGLPDVANPILLDVLNGIPPKGSKSLKVSGGDCQAWVFNNKLYLRTSLDVLSPAWQAVMSSIDGTHAYELQIAPVILALQHGKDKTLTLTLEGLE
ncbi:MAG: DotH/IcmK family type IV secretion protein [Gammaproteobacteria bacterium]|nr:DotH/IcmK family type IV secretion protein [Gammaproteobacteria bacterium]